MHTFVFKGCWGQPDESVELAKCVYHPKSLMIVEEERKKEEKEREGIWTH